MALMRRRISVLLTIALIATGMKVFEDVLGHESGLFDAVILRFIHEYIPAERFPFFASVTATGSLHFLFPVAAFTTLLLLLARRWFDAILVAVSPAIAALLVLAIKVAIGRSRPGDGVGIYAGASFPSGHTVGVAAFATAAAIVAVRFRPESGPLGASFAVAWIALVALSRLVLGAHWPTDVLAAACLGAAIPLLISLFGTLRVSRE
jgi:undecaprenyl-diphosphatase